MLLKSFAVEFETALLALTVKVNMVLILRHSAEKAVSLEARDAHKRSRHLFSIYNLKQLYNHYDNLQGNVMHMLQRN